MTRVIVTRPADQCAGWLAALQAAGHETVALPLIAIQAPADPQPVRQVWQGVAGYRLLVFVSPAAVRGFFALRPPEAPWPDTALAAAPGPGTAQALLDAGLPAACVLQPDAASAQFDSEALWTGLGRRFEPAAWQGCKILIVAGSDADDDHAPTVPPVVQQARGRPWLAQQFTAHGATVEHLVAYCRALPELSPADHDLIHSALARPAAHLWLFSSSDAVANLVTHLRRLGLALPANARALVTHPRIAQRATQAGFGIVHSCRPAVADVLAELSRLNSALP